MGPRNCIGTNLAYAEMRLILAKACLNLDLQLDERSQNWVKEQQVFGLWEKGPLFIRLTPMKRYHFATSPMRTSEPLGTDERVATLLLFSGLP